jgi:uncharacterized protein (DUF2236 family)
MMCRRKHDQQQRDRVAFPGAALAHLETICTSLTEPPSGTQGINYLEPAGDPGLFGPASVTWRVLSNPVSVFIGGITAVFLELAEPCVRSGVWDHTNFREDPVGRMRRTGLAAMVFTYGCRRDAEAATSRVRRLHERVKGVTPDGQPYRANDPELLTWVYVTAGYGFLKAYLRYVNARLPRADQDRYYAESLNACRYYGVNWVPSSVAEVDRYFEQMRPRLRHHEIFEEFLRLISNVPVVSAATMPIQRLLIEAAIDLLPCWARELLQLQKRQPLRVAMRPLVRAVVTLAGYVIRNGPPQRACLRMGLSPVIYSTKNVRNAAIAENAGDSSEPVAKIRAE